MKIRYAFVACLTLALVAAAAGHGWTAVWVVPAGTEVKVAFEQDVSSRYVEPGDEVPIRLLEAIEIGGIVVVKEGAKGAARVKKVKPAGSGGSAGMVEVELLHLQPNGAFKSADDKNLLLEALPEKTIRAQGGTKRLLSWLFIFGLFIKGGQGVLPADQPIDAKVVEDITVIVE